METKAGKMRGQQRRFYSLQSFSRVISYLTSSLSHSPSFTFTDALPGTIRNLQLPGQKASSPCGTGSLLPPPRTETTVCVPSLLELGQQPHRHSSGPNYTLHHFPTEAETGTDHSPSIGSDLHGPFHLHPAPYLLETMFSFIWRVR